MRKTKEQPEKAYSTLDAYQAGFLTLKGFIPKLVDQNGKIVFVFAQSDELLKELTAYSSGALVDASRLAFAIKTLKSQIHGMRTKKDDYHSYNRTGNAI